MSGHLALLILALIVFTAPTNALIDGQLGDFPFHVRLEYVGGYPITCSATIVAPYWALANGGCFLGVGNDLSKIEIYSGWESPQSGQLHRPIKYVRHRVKDLILIEVDKRFEATIELSSEPVKDGVQLINVGWGQVTYQQTYLTVLTVPNYACQQSYDRFNTKIEETDICAKSPLPNAGTVYRDQGSPLLTLDQKELVGITSVGLPYEGIPDVFTRIAPYADWIESVIHERKQ